MPPADNFLQKQQKQRGAGPRKAAAAITSLGRAVEIAPFLRRIIASVQRRGRRNLLQRIIGWQPVRVDLAQCERPSPVFQCRRNLPGGISMRAMDVMTSDPANCEG